MRSLITTKHLCLLLLALQAAATPAPAAELTPRITLLLSGDIDIHLQTMRGFKQRLDEYGNITAVLDIQNLENSDYSDRAEQTNPGSDLIIAIGSQATRKIVAADTAIPALSIITPKVTFDALLNDSESASKRQRSGKLTGIVLDQPPARRLRLMKMLLPESQRISILWGPISSQESEEYHAAAKAVDLELVTAVVDAEENPVPVIEGLIRDSDALLAVYDSIALNPSTAKWLLYLAYQSRLPVIGFSKAYVDAGALAAVYTTPEQIGRQAAEVVYEYLNGNSGRLPAQRYPKYFSLGLNRSVARSIGLTLPDEDRLLDELLQAEEGTRGE